MLEKFALGCIKFRKLVLAVVLGLTCIFAYFAQSIEVKTVFDDLMPTSHPYIQVHNEYKETFGGTNIITFMIQAEEGDIFQMPVLTKIRELTQGLYKIDAINEFQIYSIAGKKLKEVRASTEGIESFPYMWPDLPETQADIDYLKEAILRSPLVYGPYVSQDLTATLVTVDFFDNLLDYNLAYEQAYDLVERLDDDSVNISLVGNPILYGWVNHYLPETMQLIMIAALIFLVLLFVINRTWRGTLLPMLAGAISAIWALGVAHLCGIHFDPLVVVVAMLITARAVSHSVQMITRFHEEIDKMTEGEDLCSTEAARLTLKDLLRPGLLGIGTDAGCVTVVAISPIPLLQKLVVLAVVWVGTVAVSSIIVTPVLLSWVRKPKSYAHPINLDLHVIRPFLNLCVKIVETRARYVVVLIGLALFIVCGFSAVHLKVGDANPGSPILWPEARYNEDSAAINREFPGADRMFVVFGNETMDQEGLIKNVDTLDSMLRFQRYMEAQEEIGGSLSLADILPSVNQTLREGNFRYVELGETTTNNAELIYMFERAAEPGDLTRFTDVKQTNASVTLFFTDRQGVTIQTAVARIKDFTSRMKVEGLNIHLAGGIIGVIAAVNEVILSGQIQSIALALFILVMMCIVVYRSSIAGMFFMVPVVLSNLVTFAFMSWQNIGMNINTVPVAALGIGLGVDYALYICDRIQCEYKAGKSHLEAISISLHCAGRGVLVTALVLTASVCVWLFSSLRFQAEMGMLIGLWLAVSALSALFLMPALAYIFKPRFLFGENA
ncbi:MMPL family transporter [Porticoccus litoralis]|uniref:MMPL family transporter n=1 Tax=Porticoccus litoralis TaxID=434086 RepID=A0AAW8B1U9_9GAMM|nr:MMPL family transporter [Porticoccus litoralis]MDP1519892.1 MMPL family transporter [Porticoccus litoralis]